MKVKIENIFCRKRFIREMSKEKILFLGVREKYIENFYVLEID